MLITWCVKTETNVPCQASQVYCVVPALQLGSLGVLCGAALQLGCRWLHGADGQAHHVVRVHLSVVRLTNSASVAYVDGNSGSSTQNLHTPWPCFPIHENESYSSVCLQVASAEVVHIERRER